MRGEAGNALVSEDRHAFAAAKLIGCSHAIKSIKTLATTLANRQCTVMILGETGTGKEMVARHLHAVSERRNQPFVPVDCSALADALFESELFGHVRGAFTGAVRDSIGFIRAADGGTLFLDEVGELSLPLQAKLLRVIQERCVVPVGSTRQIGVDVRIVTATHRDLTEMVRRGEFRQDLYFRLNVVALNLPALRQRQEDILPLAEHFLSAQAMLYDEPLRRLSPEAAAALQRYPWPGNVRELANVIERAHVLADSQTIELIDLPAPLRSPRPDVAISSELCLDTVNRHAIAEALKRTNYNKAAASRLLGVNIQRLNRLISRLRVPMHPRRNSR